MLPPVPDWMAHLVRMSGKSVTARASITPQAWLAWSPARVQPIDSRTLLRAPSAPTTYLARTMRCLPFVGAGRVEKGHGDGVLPLVRDLKDRNSKP